MHRAVGRIIISCVGFFCKEEIQCGGLSILLKSCAVGQSKWVPILTARSVLIHDAGVMCACGYSFAGKRMKQERHDFSHAVPANNLV